MWPQMFGLHGISAAIPSGQSHPLFAKGAGGHRAKCKNPPDKAV
jgi:hypothetical protein